MKDFSNSHSDYMNLALNVSEKGLGKVWPNPSVGCVIRQNNSVVGVGYTRANGIHAEVAALSSALGNSRGAIVYTSLEPCSHYGYTPPCVKSLLEAKVAKVFVALRDPSLFASGIEILGRSGVAVMEGLCADRAREIHKGFLLRVSGKRPLVMLKIVTTLDGKIATAENQSKWISCAKSRQETRMLRSNYDGILTGVGSVLSDDPILTSRESEDDVISQRLISPTRIVLDTNARIPLDSRLVRTANKVPVWLFTQKPSSESKELKKAGVKLFYDEDMSVRSILKTLAKKGMTRVLVEGGPKVWTSFFKEGLVDEVMWIRVPSVIGSDGIPALNSLGVKRLDQVPKLVLVGMKRAGDCMIEFYKSHV